MPGGAQPDRATLRQWDLQHVWHPYTQMQDFAQTDFPIIARAQGSRVFDVDGRSWLDGTGSMWLNVHGHNVAELNKALTDQLQKVAHSTLLGQAGVPSIVLAKRLAEATGLPRVFFSDNGSTAVESGLKMALQYWVQKGKPQKRRIASFDGAYHGDTLGAIGAAPVPAFHAAFTKVLPDAPVRLPWPDTTRGPHRGDAKQTTAWALGEAEAILKTHAKTLAVVVVEPMVQVVGGLRIMPAGYLKGLRELCTRFDVLLLFDEVATGMGRTGKLLAADHDGVKPDLLALGKGLTGGYMPLAATLATEEVYAAFLGDYAEMKAFYHGHSYTGNALGCGVALASLDLLEQLLPTLPRKAAAFGKALEPLRDEPYVGEVRQLGFLVGIDLVRSKKTLQPFAWQSRAGWAIYDEAKQRGVLARPYASTGLLVPPLATPKSELDQMAAIYVASMQAARPALRKKAAESWPDVSEVP